MARSSAIGLDIGTSSVRAAEVSFGRGTYTLQHYGQVPLPAGAVSDGEVVDPQAVAAAIKTLWSQAKFPSRKVVLGVANQRVVVRPVDLPWLPEEELRSSLKHLVSDLVPMPVEEAILDFVPIEEVTEDDGARFVRGLLVAAAEEMVLAGIDAVSKAGLTVTTVDLSPFAILRAIAHNEDVVDRQAPEAIVDVGARVTNIVVHEGGVPRFVRILLMGGQDVTDALVQRSDIDAAQAEQVKRVFGLSAEDASDPTSAAQGKCMAEAASSLVDEIRGSLDYYRSTSGGRQLERVVVTGGGTLLEGLIERLVPAVRAPVVRGSALDGLTIGKTGLTPEQLDFSAPLATLPIGLALGVAS